MAVETRLAVARQNVECSRIRLENRADSYTRTADFRDSLRVPFRLIFDQVVSTRRREFQMELAVKTFEWRVRQLEAIKAEKDRT